MVFSETLSQASSLAERALELMRDHSVPPTPANFGVWYAHASGQYPDLSKAIDALLQRNERFSSGCNEELYRTFFGSEGQTDAVRDTSEKMQDTAVRVIEKLRQAGVDVSSFGEKLAAFGEDVANGGDLGSVIQRMLAETEAARQRNAKLETQLGEATQEIEDLRSHLEDLRIEALTDSLTGLFNRKHFDAQLRRDVLHAREAGEPLCVVFCDIDHFKRFNDTYGHATGDKVLKLVARTLKQSAKGRDTAARYGGEEFGVVLPGTVMRDALAFAEQVRRRLAGKELKTLDGSSSFGSVTMSLGVSQYRAGEPVTHLLQRADAALYASKRDGRNRVTAEAAEDLPEAAAS